MESGTEPELLIRGAGSVQIKNGGGGSVSVEEKWGETSKKKKLQQKFFFFRFVGGPWPQPAPPRSVIERNKQ